MQAYHVVQKLSDGDTAQLFLVRTPEAPGERVLEVLRPELLEDEQRRGRFLEEVALRGGLDHPHIARRVRRGTMRDGRPYVVTENVEGGTLASHLQSRGPLNFDDATWLMMPLCEGLESVHSLGRAHGNVSPQSVLLCDGLTAYHPKLIDYGIALSRSGFAFEAPRGTLVRTEYLSPERVRGHRARRCSDVYALGVMMYELVNGSPPFTGTAEEIRRKHLEESPKPLSGAAEVLWPIIERCLEKDPAHRFARALHVRIALAALLHDLEVPIALSRRKARKV